MGTGLDYGCVSMWLDLAITRPRPRFMYLQSKALSLCSLLSTAIKFNLVVGLASISAVSSEAIGIFTAFTSVYSLQLGAKITPSETNALGVKQLFKHHTSMQGRADWSAHLNFGIVRKTCVPTCITLASPCLDFKTLVIIWE